MIAPGAQALMPLLVAASAPVSVSPATEIVVDAGVVRIGDIASLAGVGAEMRARLAGRVVAHLPAGRASVTLSRAAVASLIRRAAPGLAVAAENEGPPVTIRTSAVARASGKACFALSRPVARGMPLAASDIVLASCDPTGGTARVFFDRRSSVTRAAADLAAGSHLGRIALRGKPEVDRGDRLTLASTMGPVRVERSVEAMQAGRSGQRIFVRDEDGQVFAVPFSPGQDQGKEP